MVDLCYLKRAGSSVLGLPHAIMSQVKPNHGFVFQSTDLSAKVRGCQPTACFFSCSGGETNLGTNSAGRGETLVSVRIKGVFKMLTCIHPLHWHWVKIFVSSLCLGNICEPKIQEEGGKALERELASVWTGPFGPQRARGEPALGLGAFLVYSLTAEVQGLQETPSELWV